MTSIAPKSAAPSAPQAEIPAVPLLDLARQYEQLRPEILAKLEAICASQQFILGPAVREFESAAAAFLGHGTDFHAIGCASGTDALWLALAAAGIGPGDRVLTTPFSFISSTTAILRCGATPVFADIDPATFNLCPVAARAALECADGKIKAILPVHLYGQCADWDAFSALKKEFGVLLIEDAAQSFGAVWNGATSHGQSAGNLGDAAAFSFYPTKNLGAFGDAGLVTTTSPAIAEQVRVLANHGMRRRYFHDEVGWNCRLDSLQAAVLTIKLRHLTAWNDARRRIAARYGELFRAASLDSIITLPAADPRSTHIYHQYVIRAPKRGNSVRDELRAHLTANRIGSEIYYPLPIHLQENMRSLGYAAGSLPQSERAAAEVLALPIFPELRDDEQQRVVSVIADFYRQAAK